MTVFQYQVKTDPTSGFLASVPGFGWVKQAFAEPVRPKVSVAAAVVLAASSGLFAPVLNPDTQITQKLESRWHQPWSEPVRQSINPKLAVSLAASGMFAGPLPSPGPGSKFESQWHYAWSEPVRQKPGLGAQYHPAYQTPTLNDETQIINQYESRWHYAWSEPVRFNRINTALQQDAQAFLNIFPSTTPVTPVNGAVATTWDGPPPAIIRFQYQSKVDSNWVAPVVTITDWAYILPWSEPVRTTPRLATGLNQDLAFVNIQTSLYDVSVSSWLKPFDEPVRSKSALAASQQQSATETDFIQPVLFDVKVPSWVTALSEPVRIKSGLLASHQQFYTSNFLPIIPANPWFEALSEPTRLRPSPFLTALQQSTTETDFIQSVLFDVRVSSWLKAFDEPVRSKSGLSAASQQATTETDFIQPTRFDVRVSSWLKPFDEPVRFKLGLQAYQQVPYTGPAIVITFDPSKNMSWYGLLAEPVRLKSGLLPTLQHTYSSNFTPIIPSMAAWNSALAEPVRLKPGLLPTLQHTYSSNLLPIIPRFPWFEAFSEPVRTKLGLSVTLQQFYAANILPIPNAVIPITDWAYILPWSEPVRLVRPGFRPEGQQWLAYPPRLLPKPNVTVVWASTEINSDIANIYLSTYGAIASARVSIKEISSGQTPVSLAEQFGLNSPTSLKES
jgi:hypothetical protein